MKIKEIFT